MCVSATLGESIVFPTLGASNGYWQVEIDDVDTDKTAFASDHGLIRFTWMRFELKNATGTFQRDMYEMFAPVKWQAALIFRDDIVNFSRKPEKYITHM